MEINNGTHRAVVGKDPTVITLTNKSTNETKLTRIKGEYVR